ncbi:acyltransferase [Dendrosporobacter sp. 1207_IL3150]|uniref:acyltransferase n=1 Tax=Dendrosporobacter sp. 1207_IL3150 TaxID=3084054 RepID=UPI002FD8CD67
MNAINKIYKIYWLIKTQIFFRFILKKIGALSIIIKPLKLTNPQNIIIGNDVIINDFNWLYTHDKHSSLIIDSGSRVGHFCHIVSKNRVVIGRNVLVADKVYISDNYHEYEDITKPILKQPINSKGEVYIGDNSWIGENVSVISCRVGKHCIIGANSVVNKDIPDYSVAVGSPAKVIKSYNFDSQKWENLEGSKL